MRYANMVTSSTLGGGVVGFVGGGVVVVVGGGGVVVVVGGVVAGWGTCTTNNTYEAMRIKLMRARVRVSREFPSVQNTSMILVVVGKKTIERCNSGS
jgi:hypothetical protein